MKNTNRTLEKRKITKDKLMKENKIKCNLTQIKF